MNYYIAPITKNIFTSTRMNKSSLNNSKYLSIKTVMRYRYTIMDLIKTTITDGFKAFTNIVVTVDI